MPVRQAESISESNWPRFGCYRMYIILPANSNTYHFGFILLVILCRFAVLVPLIVDSSSIVTRHLLVFYDMFAL